MSSLETLRAFFKQGFDRGLAGMELLEAEQGRAVAEIEVSEAVQNPVGTLHGGAIATLVDDVGTIAIMTIDREGRPGVTTDLNVSYLRAALPGERVRVEAETLRCGRTLAFVEVELSVAGKRIARGRMTKFMGR